ncbi:MAG: PHP domain-containing protein [Microbacteriaceae bacterium]|nr:PHP domain-containing protein [Microbacteriaceae bacterium]
MSGIDLHAHTLHSDGTETATELVRQAKEAGLEAVAITDHDNTDGWQEALAAGVELGVDVIPGIEISTRLEGGPSIHLLAYLPDPNYEPLVNVLREIRESRGKRVEKIVENLATVYDITMEDVSKFSKGDAMGRPHIADALIEKGIVKSREEAFAGILHPRGGFTIPQHSPSTTEMVRMVRDAGGVPVFAHPATDRKFRPFVEADIELLVSAGLGGIEVGHRENTPEGKIWLAEMAKKYGVFGTGSSDWHGKGKPNKLGENTTAQEVLAEIKHQGRSL